MRIQTLNMPTLGLAGQRARVPQKSAPGRAPVSRGRPAQTDSMDPVVFGIQVSTLLDRIAAERAASGTVVRRHQPAVVVVEEEEPGSIEAAPSIETPASEEIPGSTSRNDWSDLLDAMRREIEVAQSSAQPQSTGPESNSRTVEHNAPPRAQKRRSRHQRPLPRAHRRGRRKSAACRRRTNSASSIRSSADSRHSSQSLTRSARQARTSRRKSPPDALLSWRSRSVMRMIAVRRVRNLGPAVVAAVALLVHAPIVSAQAPAPDAFFGFKMGTDGRLADADAIERYFETVAAQSDRVKIC